MYVFVLKVYELNPNTAYKTMNDVMEEVFIFFVYLCLCAIFFLASSLHPTNSVKKSNMISKDGKYMDEDD